MDNFQLHEAAENLATMLTKFQLAKQLTSKKEAIEKPPAIPSHITANIDEIHAISALKTKYQMARELILIDASVTI